MPFDALKLEIIKCYEKGERVDDEACFAKMLSCVINIDQAGPV